MTAAQGAGLSVEEREALFTAGDHHPNLCDCDAYVIEQAFAEDCCCGTLSDTFTAVAAIVARRERTAVAAALTTAAEAIYEGVRQFGGTQDAADGDPVIAGLVEGHRAAARIVGDLIPQEES